MRQLPRYFFDLCVGSLSLLLLGYITIRLWRAASRSWRPLVAAAAFLIALIVIAGVALSPLRIQNRFPNDTVVITRAVAIFTVAWIFTGFLIALIWERIPRTNPTRRRLLQTATLATPAVLTAAAFINRDRLRFDDQRLTIAGLPQDLDGLRIALVSDLHLSPIVPESLVARAIDMANEARPHITVVAGDLISRFGDPLDRSIYQISRLKAEAGVYGCLGNHEMYVICEDYVQHEAGKRGVMFLRHQKQVLTFGGARLNLAGVDFQSSRKPYLIGGEKLVEPGMLNILLSHNPDVFPVAAKLGFDLTLAGHTHGGQVNFEILHHNLNIARFFTPYTMGEYRIGDAAAYVTRGVGTIGLPVRLNAPPEVTLIQLCAT